MYIKMKLCFSATHICYSNNTVILIYIHWFYLYPLITCFNNNMLFHLEWKRSLFELGALTPWVGGHSIQPQPSTNIPYTTQVRAIMTLVWFACADAWQSMERILKEYHLWQGTLLLQLEKMSLSLDGERLLYVHTEVSFISVSCMIINCMKLGTYYF